MTARVEIARDTGMAIITGVLRGLWNLVRLPILAVLVLCEPIVQFVCATVMVLGVFVAVLFEISAAGPKFPCLWMVGFSLSFGVFLILYHFLIAALMD